MATQVLDTNEFLNEAIHAKDFARKVAKENFLATTRLEKENDSLRNQTVYLHQLIQMNEQKAGTSFI